MGRSEVFQEQGVRIASREQLTWAGASGRSLTAAVRDRQLIRVRRDHYALPGTPVPIIQSVRIGGRMRCLSALADHRIFAIDKTFTHAHVEQRASRTPHPNNRWHRLTDRERDGVEVHWGALIDPEDGSESSVGVRDALAQVLLCQHRWYSVASIDSALQLGLLTQPQLGEVFARAPERLQPLLARVNERAEAGQETVLRMVLEEAGLNCEIQVQLPGVGRVDLIVEGCVVVEADSRLAHDGWDLHVRDRDRDIDVARLGFSSLRPAYQRTMNRPNDVLGAVIALVRAHGRFRVHV